MSLASADSMMVRVGRYLKDNPVVPLLLFLFLLIALLEIMRPGIVTPYRAGRDGIVSMFWVGNLIKFAIPLAMLAACQVLTMLTAGIDLSAGIVATVAAFVCATLSSIWGVAPATIIALLTGLLVGLVNGFGVGIVRVHPLIMTLGTGLITTGCLQVYQRLVINAGSEIPAFLAWLG
ncbi:MAG: ABC transporter permease, partial [Altererythrobacter sp.]|nr:ABC transporter permease [Altererythrobacter sp.]